MAEALANLGLGAAPSRAVEPPLAPLPRQVAPTPAPTPVEPSAAMLGIRPLDAPPAQSTQRRARSRRRGTRGAALLLVPVLAVAGYAGLQLVGERDPAQKVASDFTYNLYVGDAGQAYLALCQDVRAKTSAPKFLAKAAKLHKLSGGVTLVGRNGDRFTFQVPTATGSGSVTISVVNQDGAYRVC